VLAVGPGYAVRSADHGLSSTEHSASAAVNIFLSTMEQLLPLAIYAPGEAGIRRTSGEDLDFLSSTASS
jgi:hypothetical protein